jgi:hypothetical protein
MLWKRFLRYIAQREVAAERERLDRYAELIGVRFGSVPVAGTHASFLAALGEACQKSLPCGFVWTIEERVGLSVSPGTLRVIVERASAVTRRAS